MGDSDPSAAVQQAVEGDGFDEITISTLPARASHQLRHSTVPNAWALGRPVTAVTAEQSERAVSDAR